jgi:hypothetical protein
MNPTIYEHLIQLAQDEARRHGERDRLLLEARRIHRARCQRVVPPIRVRRLVRLLFRRAAA